MRGSPSVHVGQDLLSARASNADFTVSNRRDSSVDSLPRICRR